MKTWENIPEELRTIPHWVAAGGDKKPINPKTGRLANPADPSTGGTFEEAVLMNMDHIGFILSNQDPYAIVDLDDPFDVNGETIDETHVMFPNCLKIAERHKSIMEHFDTYAELSQSKKGAHIVCRGSVITGSRRDRVEVYSDQRYMIFTGNFIGKKKPINDCQTMLNRLYEEIGSSFDNTGNLIEIEPLVPNREIWKTAINASNCDEFISLCEGHWGKHPSQSEADFSLISRLCFFTKSNRQVREMFRETKLGERPKAKNDRYLNRAIKKIRSEELPLVDISQLKLSKSIAEEKEELALESGHTFPSGLVGEIAQYIYDTSTRPILEVSLAGALGLCAGIVGRAFNISGTGLNQYIILLAKSGRGKEGAATGIDNLIAAIRVTVPRADEFIGPASFASGQGLIKSLDTRPCFVSVLGEFGLTLQQICDARASSADVMLKKVLLDIYAKSGHSKLLRSTSYSDVEKNTKVIQAPNVTLLGESTPTNFFKKLDYSHISEGLIPRFSVIEYKGKRPKANKDPFAPPSAQLISKIIQLINAAIVAQDASTVTNVLVSEKALLILDSLNDEADEIINSARIEAESELWNRAHLKGLKLAALIAVGNNPIAPEISKQDAQWAVDFVRREINGMMDKFKTEGVGSGELKQEFEVKRMFEHFQKFTPNQKAESWRCPTKLLESDVAPYSYLSTYCRKLPCFNEDRRGPTKALKETLDEMLKKEVLGTFSSEQMRSEFGTRAVFYSKGPAF